MCHITKGVLCEKIKFAQKKFSRINEVIKFANLFANVEYKI